MPGQTVCGASWDCQVLVNNASFQGTGIQDITELDRARIERTFAVNIVAMFSIVKAAVDHMKPGSCIINVSSVTGEPSCSVPV